MLQWWLLFNELTLQKALIASFHGGQRGTLCLPLIWGFWPGNGLV